MMLSPRDRFSLSARADAEDVRRASIVRIDAIVELFLVPRVLNTRECERKSPNEHSPIHGR